MKRDIAVGATSGYTFEQVKYWLNSLDRAGFVGDRVVLLGNGDDQLVKQLEDRGCCVIPRASLIEPVAEGLSAEFVDRDMCVERYLLLWKFLSSLRSEDVRFVISVDMRDAVFQLDPGEWLAANLADKAVVVSSEGLAYGHEPWNRDSMRAAFGASIFDQVRDRVVWNCGTIAGEMAALRDLSLNLYLCSRTVTYADQSALNVLLGLWPYKDVTLFDYGDVGWACQSATMAGLSRGPELSYRFRGSEPLFDGQAVYTAAGQPFCVVHQYDRIPFWKLNLERRFG